MIDPGVLEGGDENDSGETGSDSTTGSDTTTDSGETDSGETDSSDTESSDLAECVQGTNPQGGVDPGDFPIGNCPAFVCDEGWGHGGDHLPIAWTLEFPTPESKESYTPVGVVPRSTGDGVLIVARLDVDAELSDTDTELLTVSAQGELLSSTILATSMWIDSIEAGEGMIFLHAFDEQDSSTWVLAISETGELLWSSPVESGIHSLAALPNGGVVAASIQDGGGKLAALSPAGALEWTAPTLTPVGLAVSPAGRILVTGHHPLEFTEHFMMIHAPDGEPLGQTSAPGMIGELSHLEFLDEHRVLAAGDRYSEELFSSDAVVQLLDLDIAASTWAHDYNRALDNCYEGPPVASGYPTWEFFEELVRLDDGSFLMAATEESDTNYFMQPRVLHIDEDGQLLASDRGLWYGQGRALAAGEDGSAYALLAVGGYLNYDSSNDGFYLRKYQP